MRQRATFAHTGLSSEITEWPTWVRPELDEAIAIAAEFRAMPGQTTLAGELYHEWFTPPVVHTPAELLRRPLAGLYRQAHAGSTRRNDLGELPSNT